MWHDGFLYLATKNRTVPFDGKTHLYRIPDAPGAYEAIKIDVWDSGGDEITGYWVTAGDISTDGKILTLLSGDKMWVFHDYFENDFFSGEINQIDFVNNTQKEGICFVNNDKIYITDEQWFGGIGRKLYTISIETVVTPVYVDEAKLDLNVYPNPSHDKLIIHSEEKLRNMEVIDITGRRYTPTIYQDLLQIELNMVGMPAGMLFITFTYRNRKQMIKVVKVNK